MHPHIHIPDTLAAAEAAELIDLYGTAAADEAMARASRSRDVGNVVHFCRWRQIGRLIERLDWGSEGSTIH